MSWKKNVVAFAFALTSVAAPCAAEDAVAECRDAARYPTPAHRRDCLGRSADPRAIRELHAMARDAEEYARRGDRSRPWPEAFASSAGEVAARTETTYLAQLAHTGDARDRVFALDALDVALSEVELLRPDAARTAAIRKVLAEACRANGSSNDLLVRGKAENCLRRLAPRAESRPRKNDRGLLSVLSRPQKPGDEVNIFDGDAPALAGAPGQSAVGSVRLACLQGAVRAKIELCYPDMPALRRDYYLALTAQRHPSAFATGDARWVTERSDAAGHESRLGTLALPLRAGERVASKGLRVVARDGDMFLVFLPFIRGEAEPYGAARAALVTLDATKGWVGKPWSSGACAAGCRVPEVEVAPNAGGKEVRVRLDGTAGALVDRARWSKGGLEPAPAGR